MMFQKICSFFRNREKNPEQEKPGKEQMASNPKPLEPEAGPVQPAQEDMLQAHQPAPRMPMAPVVTGDGPWVSYEGCGCRTSKIQWVSLSQKPDGTPVMVRQPREETKKFSHSGPFVAASRRYENLDQLHAVDSGDHMRFHDIYGRRVFYDAERFPCFDSYDYANEKRFYRWFFILGEDTLTRVFYTDTREWIHVTEDAGNIETARWKEMLQYKFFEWEC